MIRAIPFVARVRTLSGACVRSAVAPAGGERAHAHARWRAEL